MKYALIITSLIIGAVLYLAFQNGERALNAEVNNGATRLEVEGCDEWYKGYDRVRAAGGAYGWDDASVAKAYRDCVADVLRRK